MYWCGFKIREILLHFSWEGEWYRLYGNEYTDQMGGGERGEGSRKKGKGQKAKKGSKMEKGKERKRGR